MLRWRNCEESGWIKIQLHLDGKISMTSSAGNGFLSRSMCDIIYLTRYFCYSKPIRSQSTVMLTVDLTFLAVPSVNADESQSVTIIAAYLATFCVIGSLVVSILLAGQNRKYGNVSADTAVWDTSTVDCARTNNPCAGRIPYQNDKFNFRWESPRNLTRSSVRTAYVGVSTLRSVIPADTQTNLEPGWYSFSSHFPPWCFNLPPSYFEE